MIAPNLIEQVRERLASAIGVYPDDERRFSVDIPLSFPDGDQCRVYIERGEAGDWRISDAGASVMRASYAANVNVMGEGHRSRFRQLLDLYGLTEQKGELSLSIPESELGDGVFTLAQVAIDVVNLARLPKEKGSHDRSDVKSRIRKMILSNFPSTQPNWCDEKHDRDRLYCVPYRIDAPIIGTTPAFVFPALSLTTCMRSTMTCLFHRANRTRFRSVVIYDESSEVNASEKKRLNSVADDVFQAVPTYEEFARAVASHRPT